jgi:hypothetical protein
MDPVVTKPSPEHQTIPIEQLKPEPEVADQHKQGCMDKLKNVFGIGLVVSLALTLLATLLLLVSTPSPHTHIHLSNCIAPPACLVDIPC